MMESPAESAKHFWKRCTFENRDCHVRTGRQCGEGVGFDRCAERLVLIAFLFLRQCFVSMWLVRKASGEPVFFQCAVLPLE